MFVDSLCLLTRCFAREATGGEFDAAMEMLVSVNSEAAAAPAAQQEDFVRAPIAPTRRQVLVEALPGDQRCRSAHLLALFCFVLFCFVFFFFLIILLFLFFLLPRFYRRPEPLPEDFSPFSLANIGHHKSEKAETLARLFRPPIEITYQGDFDSACKAAEKAGKLLLVNVQDQQEFECQVLNRDTWSNEALKRFVSENFIFLQPSVQNDAGRYYIQYYGAPLCPHIAILDPITKFREIFWEGPGLTALKLTEYFRTFLRERSQTHPIAPAVADAPQVLDRSMSKHEQEALERAIKESLSDAGQIYGDGEEEVLQEEEEEGGGEEEEIVVDEPSFARSKFTDFGLDDEDLAVAISRSLADEQEPPDKKRKTEEVKAEEEKEEEEEKDDGSPLIVVRVRDSAGVVVN